MFPITAHIHFEGPYKIDYLILFTEKEINFFTFLDLFFFSTCVFTVKDRCSWRHTWWIRTLVISVLIGQISITWPTRLHVRTLLSAKSCDTTDPLDSHLVKISHRELIGLIFRIILPQTKQKQCLKTIIQSTVHSLVL